MNGRWTRGGSWLGLLWMLSGLLVGCGVPIYEHDAALLAAESRLVGPRFGKATIPPARRGARYSPDGQWRLKCQPAHPYVFFERLSDQRRLLLPLVPADPRAKSAKLHSPVCRYEPRSGQVIASAGDTNGSEYAAAWRVDLSLDGTAQELWRSSDRILPLGFIKQGIVVLHLKRTHCPSNRYCANSLVAQKKARKRSGQPLVYGILRASETGEFESFRLATPDTPVAVLPIAAASNGSHKPASLLWSPEHATIYVAETVGQTHRLVRIDALSGDSPIKCVRAAREGELLISCEKRFCSCEQYSLWRRSPDGYQHLGAVPHGPSWAVGPNGTTLATASEQQYAVWSLQETPPRRVWASAAVLKNDSPQS